MDDGREEGPSSIVDRLIESEAVRLFVARARAAAPSFVLSAANAAAVAAVCRRLDGIPLALELAAARLSRLTLEQIADRLDDRFSLLDAGQRVAVTRHRTLRALVDWSHELLSPPEQALLRRLAVFAGTFTAEAASAVHGVSDAVDLLGRLVEKSLATAEDRHDARRYRLLETIRDYAAEKLRESGEEDEIRRRHRDWYVDFAEQSERMLRTTENEIWTARTEAEHDNLRAAIAWSRRDPADPAGPRLVAALFRFWDVRGHWGEAWEQVGWALGVAGVEASVRAKLLNGYGMLAYERGDFDRAVDLAREALALCREGGDTWGTCYALETLGLIMQFRRRYVEAAALLEESLALARASGDLVNAAFSLLYLGVSAMVRGRAELAAERYRESLELWRLLRNKHQISLTLMLLGRIAVARGRLNEARATLDESLELARQAGSPRALGWALLYLGYLARQRGDLDEAHAYYKESLDQRFGSGDRRGIAQCLEGLAAVETGRVRAGDGRRAGRAALLWGAAERLRDTIASPIPPYEQPEYERDLGDVRAALGDGPFAGAWSAGRSLSLAAAVAEAHADRRRAGARRSRSVGARPAQAVRRTAAEAATDPGLLSPREREIAGLIAGGMTSRQIAERLGIGKRTVDTHAWSIMAKLGLVSRTQLAAWAAEHHLANRPA